MAKVVVAGLINLETTLRVDAFPITYEPVRYPFFGIRTGVSGVGYNVAKAMHTLGDEVKLLSLIGQDDVAQMVIQALQADGLAPDDIQPVLIETPQSVILYDGEGRRAIQVDLKDIQEQHYPFDQTDIASADIAVVGNINFARPLLDLSLSLVTDVHALSDLQDPYNRDFMAAADVLFLSDERLPYSPEACIRRLQSMYHPEVVVVGMGSRGILYATKQMVAPRRIAAVAPRPVINTIGAGDALLSAFTHFYARGCAVEKALRRAVVFAGYKIGVAGAAEGFLNEKELQEIMLMLTDST